MNKIYFKDILIFIINILVLFLIITNDVLSTHLIIGNYYLTYSSILAFVLFITIIMIKSNEKIALMYDYQRIDLPRLLGLFTYKFFYISFIFAFMQTNQISFLAGLIIIFSEFLITILTMMITIKNIQYTGTKKVMGIRDGVYSVLVVVLILNNMPFELYAIPADAIIITIYMTVMLYICYSLIEILRPEL